MDCCDVRGPVFAVKVELSSLGRHPFYLLVHGISCLAISDNVIVSGKDCIEPREAGKSAHFM